MAKVHVINVVVLDNPSPFNNPFQFEITFECLEDLKEDLEWKLIYVGSAESEDFDQTLDCVYVGPVPEGRHMFVFQADPPDSAKIPIQDAVGVTVILLSSSYRGKEFIRVGYYVNNEYVDQELRENPPAQPRFDRLQRNILATNPRVTRFQIDWCDPPSLPVPNHDTNGENEENEQPVYGDVNPASQMFTNPYNVNNTNVHGVARDETNGNLKPTLTLESNLITDLDMV